MDVGVTLYDASAGGRLVLGGGDCRSFLHNFCTNDIEGLGDGETCEAFVTDMTGHVLGHVWVTAEAERLWLHALANGVDLLEAHFQKYLITEDVMIEDRTAATSRVVLVGAGAGTAADRIAESVSEACGERFHRASVDWLGDGDVLLWLESDDGSELLLSALATGVSLGTPEAFESGRIAALLPVFGRDIDSTHLAQEVDRDCRAISLTKGCYLGQETIARVASRGRVNRVLRGLEFEGPGCPEPGAALYSEDEREVGRVGSVVPREAISASCPGTAQALAVVRREVSESGTRVRIATSVGSLWTRIVSPVD